MRSFLLYISLLLCFNNAFASLSESIRFSHISIKDGLSQSTIFDITQDHNGFMWFATFDGLNKYDGYSFSIYRNSKEDTTSISSNSIRTVISDSHKRIWVGTDNGLSLYNETQDNFINFYPYSKKESTVNKIKELSDSTLLISTPKGLNIFNTQTRLFSDNYLPAGMRGLSVSAMYRKDDMVYIGTKNGQIFIYDIRKNQIRLLKFYNSKAAVQCIVQSGQFYLWIATEGEGLYAFDLKSHEIRNYRHTGNKGDISSNYIRTLAFDSQERLWVGTFNDLNIYNESKDQFHIFTHNALDSESLSQRSVRSIYRDEQGGMWIGTYFGGLNYYHPLKNRFTNIRKMPYSNSLNDNVVSCITEDNKGNLWIGTNDNGINFYNPRTQNFKHYKIGEGLINKGLESNNIKSIYIDNTTGLVYVGAHAGGINIITPSTGHVEHFNLNNDANPGNVYSICEFNQNILLLGTLEGLYTFDKTTKKITKYNQGIDGMSLTQLRITIIYKDSQGHYWVGAENGLEIYSITDAGIEKYIPENKELLTLKAVQDIKETTDKCILISTRNGLYKYNSRKEKLLHFTVNNGLPNNVVYGTEEDSYGRIWISTNYGLCRYSPNTGKFRNFTVNDGIQSNEFNNYSHCRTADGKLYFGGINGITTFFAETLNDNPYTPKPIIKNLFLFNKRVIAGDGTGILTKNISETNSITLNNTQNSITLEFVVSNYISGQHNIFAYRLNGHEDEWYFTRNDRKISYSNLPPGEYTFEVKSSNSDGIWNPEPSTLEIIVLPAWYETIWAKLLFLIFIISIISFILRHLWVRKNMQTQLELEKKDKEHQEEISQMKMRFFINISHELRTPLTLILAPLQDLIYKTTDKWAKQQLKYIERNANRLLHLVNQLMDYRRAELGVFKLRVCHKDIHQPMKEIFSFYEKLAKSKQIKYSMTSNVESVPVYADRQYMELILNNLLSNAFKYTEDGEINVYLGLDNGQLVLKVQDTGEGIPQEKQARIFERFYQANSEHIGSGIGLSLVQRLVELHHGEIKLWSEVGKGSQFEIHIPQDVQVYKQEELNLKKETQEEEPHSTNVKEKFYLDNNGSAETEDELTIKKGTILIAEDNQEILEYISNGLKPIFKIIQAKNGEDAFNKIKDENIDLVITDIVMPVMDGIKLCKQIKQNLSTNHIPVIILSGQTNIESQLEALKIGADDYMQKPFSLSVLTKKIQNILRTRQRIIDRTSKSIEVEPEKMTFNLQDEELLKRAVEIVKKNIDNSNFSAEDFAAEMNMSRSNLHIKLKAITGESAIEFIKKIRFGEACRLIKEGKYSISEISAMVGFNTPSYFATSFKKYIGCLPTEYMKKKN